MGTSEEDRTSLPDPAVSPPREPRLAPYDTFVARVRKTCVLSPGTQQALRRGLAKPVDEAPARTHAALLRNGLVPDTATGAERRAYYAVAALIAARPRAERDADSAAHNEGAADDSTPLAEPDSTKSSPPPETGMAPATGAPQQRPQQPAGQRLSWGVSLGASLAQAAVRDRPDGTKKGGLESRLHLLVRQDTDGLHRMLPAVLRQLGSAGVPADYGRLLYDLARWPYRREATVTRWLEDFYRTLRRTEQHT